MQPQNTRSRQENNNKKRSRTKKTSHRLPASKFVRHQGVVHPVHNIRVLAKRVYSSQAQVSPKSESSHLFTPLQLGDVTLSHRITMTALTRCRADELLRPTDLHATYYSQRATPGGLLVSEATIIAPESVGSRCQPGIWTPEQTEAWSKVTRAVHDKNGFIACQLWHQGRNSHASYNNHPLVKAAHAKVCEAPSEVAGVYPTWTFDNHLGQATVPHAVTIEDIERIKQQFVTAASNALDKAGFDFVELHGASGYLIDQFLNDSSNLRTDKYGGSIENRLRFMIELVEMLVEKFPRKIAIRISPNTPQASYFGTKDSNPDVLYKAVFAALAKIKGLVYVSIAEPVPGVFTPNERPVQHSHALLGNFREINPDTKLFTAAGYSPQSAYETFSKHTTPTHDAIGFGRWFISNPDLVFRLHHELPLNEYNRNTFYTQPDTGAANYHIGYTDYPTFEHIVHTKFGPQVNINNVIENNDSINQLLEASRTDKYPLVSVQAIGYSSNSQQRAASAQRK